MPFAGFKISSKSFLYSFFTFILISWAGCSFNTTITLTFESGVLVSIISFRYSSILSVFESSKLLSFLIEDTVYY